ncbi:glycosyltransferase family 2 protein [Patescibacteria group bacterium]
MLQNHPLVSVNILTYNGEKYIRECIESVLNQRYPNIEIIIIDNNSSDCTISEIKKFDNNPKIYKIIFNNEQSGFAVGHNQAIRQSRGDFILCLNQDVVLHKDFVDNAIALLEKNTDISSIQGKVLRFNSDGSFSKKIDTTGLVILKNRRIINRGQGKIDNGQFEKEEEVFGADGACPIYRKKALEDIKVNNEFFDEDFFAYKEDVDLAWRLRLRNWKCVYHPMVIAWHWRGSGDSAERTPWGIIRERKKLSKFSKYLAFKNQRLMQIKNEQVVLLIKHFPWVLMKEVGAWAYILFFETYTLRAVYNLIKQIPKALEKRKIIMTNKKANIKEMNKWFN